MRKLVRRLAVTMFCGRCGKFVEIIPGTLRCSECGL